MSIFHRLTIEKSPKKCILSAICNVFVTFGNYYNVHTKKEQFLLFRIRVHQDRDAFEQIYYDQLKSIRRLLYAKLPVNEVDDALMTTFFRLWDYLSRTEVENVSGLTFTIARGVIAGFYRSRKIDEVPLEGNEDKAQAESATIAQAELALLRDVLKELPEAYQEVIVLRYFEDLPFKEIGKRLHKTESASRVLLHRARKELRKSYGSIL